MDDRGIEKLNPVDTPTPSGTATEPEQSSGSVDAELAGLVDSNGVLRPADVVEFARDADCELHSHFQWDDSEAAHQFRLEQARRIIRARVVQVASGDKSVEVRAFVSLSQERQEGESYRLTVDVLSDEERRAMMLTQARRELQGLRRKYGLLRELAEVWEALSRVADTP